MKNFVKGCLFMAIAVPLAELLVGIFQQLANLFCTWLATKAQPMAKQLEEEPEVSTNVIGFQVPSNEEYYDDEEDE